MSTAGKVLAVLILLVSLAWVFLAAGVAQLNRNGNAALAKLQADVANAKEGVKKAQIALVKIKDDTALFQSSMDTKLAVLRAQMVDVEAGNSRLNGILNNMQAQLQTVEATVAEAQHDLEIRNTEKETEIKLLAAARAEVQQLRDRDAELADRLASLRKEFKDKFSENVGQIATATR